VPTRVLQQQWIKQYFLTLWDSPGAKIRTIGNTDGDYVRNAGQITPGTITVAVAKSLRENPAFNPAEGVKSLIIADEVHNYTSEASQEMLSSSYTRRLGLTATLEPPQGRYPVLANFFGGDPIYRYDFTRAVKDKVISPYNLVTIGVPLEREIARLYTAAYIRMKNAKDQLLILGNIVNNPDTLNRAIEIFNSKGLHSSLIKEYESAFEESDIYLREANSKAGAIRLVTDFIKTRGNTIVFSDLVATARNIQIIFKERGLDSEVISAEVPQSERETIFRKLKNQSISALLSPKALDEGVDIEELSTGVFAGASRRRLQIIQRLGRVLRISDSKQMPLLIIIVADGTEEDPCMPNNESMKNSPFGVVYDQAISKIHFKLEDEEQIRLHLLKLAENSQN
jgi:RNA polymerase primary sigma factor